MKHNLRRILAVLVIAVSMMGLTACGGARQQEKLSYDEAYLQSVADFLVSSWDGLSAADIAAYGSLDAEDAQEMLDMYQLPFTAEAFTTAFSGYEGSVEELGAYVSTDGYEVSVDGDEITLVAHLTYEQRKADLSIVFNSKEVAQSVTLAPEYTTSEILTKAVMNTILGMGTVFIVLIFISLVIYCFNFIPAIQKKFSRKKEEIAAPVQAPAPVKAAVETPAPAVPETDETELVAAITAAICAYTGSSADGFVVRSIRRAESATWKKA
ncbi:MAG: OadG family transporter subunit [Eubacteriales bacterium]|nr:OadG family transporter subunit [Eubacteriales bacterium]